MDGPRFAFDNTYARLPEGFFARVQPTAVTQPRLLLLNRALADELGVDLRAVDDDALAAIFAGNRLAEGSEPLSMAYAGHQFGGFSPQLGDGRAILLGEILDRQGRRRDIQLKGSGRTPYSRRGDGRAALGPVLREFIVSEAMHALGIPSTRALAAVSTGEAVFRDTLLPGAVFTRVAASHIRVGTFQFFAARGDAASVRRLAQVALERHYPEEAGSDRPFLALLEAFARRHAALVAQWMGVGFIHGVMNTDNMAVSGETIDFGPCAFLEAYDPQAVFSAIDEQGRYAYANQPWAAQWNLARFAETLVPLIDADIDRATGEAQAVISGFPALFEQQWLALMRRKLGLAGAQDDDADLIGALLDLMHAQAADFTLTFRKLCALAETAGAEADAAGPRALFADPSAFDAWAQRWRQRLHGDGIAQASRAQAMRAVNPARIPRNHRVEQALAAAIERGDLGPTRELIDALARPYAQDPKWAALDEPAAPAERVTRTFCGT